MHPTLWPSGLRRWLQAPVRKGVGSNPTGVIWRSPTSSFLSPVASMCGRIRKTPTARQWQRTKMTPVGFEPTQLALVDLESTPLDHSGKVSSACATRVWAWRRCCQQVQPQNAFTAAARIPRSFVGEGMLQSLVLALGPRRTHSRNSDSDAYGEPTALSPPPSAFDAGRSHLRAQTVSITDDRRSWSKTTKIPVTCIETKGKP